MHQNQNKNKHVPVLVGQVITFLEPQEGESYLDLTAGYGGHAQAILEQTKAPKSAVLVDRDENAISFLKQLFKGQGVGIENKDFETASHDLLKDNKKFDLILADLGVSSPHLDIASRGFSIRDNGPLDMRMDQRQTITAANIVNSYGETELIQLLRDYGEEPKARMIAQAIIANRPIDTTSKLAKIVANIWHGHSRIHPATRTFQALRIAVNDELGQLERSLPLWEELLAPNGRMAIISFHSLEDRLVKRFLTERAGERYDASLRILTNRPVTGDDKELVSNPRARSAKLRVAVKIKNQKERGD